MPTAASSTQSAERYAAPPDATPEAPWLTIAVYALAVALAVVGLAHVFRYYHDDAYISLRYAARLLSGAGLTWNPGERVEGFTHPFWLAQVVTLGAVGIDLPTATRLLGMGYLVALFVLWWRVRAAPPLLLLLATQPALLVWAVSGLETVAFAFWLTAGALCAQEAVWTTEARRANSRAALAGVALGLATLTRPEGAGVEMMVVALLLVHRQTRAAVTALATFGAIVGSYELFRLAYFGDWLPNTAYAKVSGLRLSTAVASGFSYLNRTLKLWAPAAVAALVAFALARGRRPTMMMWLVLPLMVTLLIAGGDHMPDARFMVPPVVLVTFAAGVAGRAGFRHRLALAVVAIAAVTQLIRLETTGFKRDMAALIGEQVGRYLAANLPAGSLVATATAGSTAYFAPSLQFIDTLGLNDRTIARRPVGEPMTKWQAVPGHAKGDGRYVLERGPDVILLGPADGYVGEDPTAWFLTDFELLHNPEFRDRYEPYALFAPVPLEIAAERPLAFAGDREPVLVITVFLRKDSPAVTRLRTEGMAVPQALVRDEP